MKERTLYLAWQDQQRTREWFPIGRLDVAPDNSSYRFAYIQGAKRAAHAAGFVPLPDFPDWNGRYESSVLFPLFMNRVIQSSRKDFPEYLQLLDLPEHSDPADILAVGGGQRITDNFEVFPKLEPNPDGSFESRFFLHGWRHLNSDAQNRILRLQPGEGVFVTVELTNPVMKLAVQIQTEDYYVIGWAPRYLVKELVELLANPVNKFKATVVRLNPSPAPVMQRLLIELKGHWPNYQPMSSPDFEPLVA